MSLLHTVVDHAAPGKGTVIAVHGVMESAETLAPLAREITTLGWDVVRLDLRGHGLSPRWSADMLDRGADGRGRLHPGDVMVADVERTLALEPITAPIVVYGHSAGGAVAAAVAADLGPRVAGVLLEDPFWRLPVTPFQDSDVAREAESRLLRLQALEAPARIAAIRAEWPDWAADEVEAQATSSALVQPAIVRDGDLIPTVPWPELVAQLISARVRVTVVTGTGRVGMTAAHQRVLRDAGAHVEVIAGADHFVRRDRPAAFRLVLEEFLHTVSSRSPHE